MSNNQKINYILGYQTAKELALTKININQPSFMQGFTDAVHTKKSLVSHQDTITLITQLKQHLKAQTNAPKPVSTKATHSQADQVDNLPAPQKNLKKSSLGK